MKKLCGFRPTGRLHLGHYFSVILPALQGCDVLVATYHAEEPNREEAEKIRKYGVKNLIYQEDVFNPKLYFDLLKATPFGLLRHMTQFKSSPDPTAHLFVYPVLMAHDLFGYDEVYVGEDQRQHVEFSRELFRKLGMKECVGVYSGGKVMDLRHPDQKMSKSKPETCLFLDDSPEEIRKKIKVANTNGEGLKNLHFLYRHFIGEPPERNDEMKENLAEKIIETVWG